MLHICSQFMPYSVLKPNVEIFLIVTARPVAVGNFLGVLWQHFCTQTLLSLSVTMFLFHGNIHVYL